MKSKSSPIQQAMALSPLDFISRLTIINKDGKRQQLRPNAEQIKIIETLEGDGDTIILKPRQIGSSTITVAYLFYLAYISREPVTFAILSYKLNSSKHLLNIAKAFYQYLPKGLQREIDVDNSTELSFKGGGRILAVASTQRGGLRSFTASKILISEYAFAEQPEELKATALAALNDGQLIIESTANYYNDCLHQEIIKWETGVADYNFLFFPWSEHTEYNVELTDDIPALTEEEMEIQKEYGLSIGQILWRRDKMSKIGWEKFIREYPLTIDEAYRISGSTYFKYEDFANCNIIQVEPGEWCTFEDAKPDHSYSIGVDTSGGVGKDYSVIVVMCKNTNQIACIFRSNRISPIELAEYIHQLHLEYNNALVLVEANNYGLATINELGHQGCNRLWKDTNGKDFLTTAKTKPLLFENLKKEIQSGRIRDIDNITMLELRSITVDERGIIKFSDLIESHSDSAMALSLACWCLNDVKIKQTAYLPDWIKDRRAQRIMNKTGAGIQGHQRY